MRVPVLILTAVACAYAQADLETITVVSASVPATSGPDTVYYDAGVTAPAGTGLDEVLKTLATVGASERDLLAVVPTGRSLCNAANRNCSPAFAWSFRFSSPVAKMPEILKALGQAGSSVSYSVQSGGVSPAAECAYPTLISQARRHAANLASAAGVRVGRMVALSESLDQSLSVPVAVLRVGDFSQTTAFGGLAFGYPPPYIAPAPCAVVVQFELLR